MQNIWKENILAVAIILGISIFIFFGALFSNKVLVPVDTLSKEYPWKVIMPQKEDLTRYSLSDATAVFYPWKIFISKELKRGAFPLWCDELGAGYPMSGVSGIYGLSTALLWLFSPQLANNLFHLLEIFLAMLGMFIFLRYMRLLLFPCLVGAISFGLSYPVLEYLSVENIVGALVALPWLFYCLERYYSCGRRYYVALSALIFGMAILNSSIQSMSYILLALLAYFITRVLYEYRVEKVHHLRDHLFVFLAIVALGSALSAVFLIPNLKFFLFDNNRQRFDNISWFAMLVKKPLILTPAVIIGTIFPEFLGNVNTIDFKSAIETIFGKLNFGAVYSSGEWRAYIGVAPLLCAIVAVSKCTKSFYAQLALWVAIFPAAVALFTPLYMFTYLRLLGVTSFGLAILAAIGLDWMMKNRGYDGPLFRRLLIYSMAFLSVVLLFSAVISIKKSVFENLVTRKVTDFILSGNFSSLYGYDIDWQIHKAISFVENYTLMSPFILKFALITVLTLIVFRYFRAVGNGICLGILVFLFTVVDLVELSGRMLPFVDQSNVYPSTSLIEYLQKQNGEYRVISEWNRLTEPPTARPNELLPYGISDARICESLTLEQPLFDEGRYDLLNVRFLITPPEHEGVDDRNYKLVYSNNDGKIYEKREYFPRIFLMPIENYSDDNGTLITQIDTVLRGNNALQKIDTGFVRILDREEGSLKLAINAPVVSVLVLLDRMYPGWRATIDGDNVDILEVLGMMRAVIVPSGPHNVKFIFRPRIVIIGAGISLFTIIFLVGFCLKKNYISHE